jgi:hypothetical protein
MIYKGIILTVLAFTVMACNNTETPKESVVEVVEEVQEEGIFFPMEKNGIKLSIAPESPAFADAKLALISPDISVAIPAGKTVFKYEVGNFELGGQTKGENHCANSEKGQHIHYIMDNAPYSAHYEPYVETELGEGKHLLLSFLSRSYHESIKNGTAHILKQVNVGNAEGDDFDLSAPHLFYSRPKGTYSGHDTHHLLLDFFLVNADLSDEGYKVKATINGTEFMLNQWVPYLIEGLGDGEHTVKIELMDAEGNSVSGPFNNSGERTITIEGSHSH